MTKDAILELPTGGISGIKQPLQIQQQAAQKAGGNIFKKLFGKK
jgi:hypothetical protein